MKRVFATTFLALALAGSSTPAVAAKSAVSPKDPARAITSQLICPCSCGEILSGCTCDTGKGMQGFVTDALKSGKGKDEIVASLVGKYGEVILGAPKAKGFNLIVWVAPFVATLIGFLIAALVLRRWVRRGALIAVTPGVGRMGTTTTADQDLAILRARAEAELRKMRE
jgi:cytochrome c-type biogenesis protein CcmH/NrfF